MKYPVLLALTCLTFALIGCSHATPTAALASPTPSKTASPTTLSTAASIKMPAPTPTAANTPLPPTPTAGPLSQTGPWLMLFKYYSQGRIDPTPVTGPIFSNADGSAWESANLTHNPKIDDSNEWSDAWSAVVAPKGGHIAFREDFYFDPWIDPWSYVPGCDKDNPFRPDETGRFNTLSVLKLPENKVVMQLQLLGQEAIEAFRKAECAFAEKNVKEMPPVLAIILDRWNVRWSPDGRYLAFTAAPDHPDADIFLYDTQTAAYRRLTTRQNNPVIMGWSPDGQTIIYRNTIKMGRELAEFWESSGVYAVSLSGADRLLFKPGALPGMIGWVSSTQLLIDDGFCDPWHENNKPCTTHLRLVDITTGMNEVFYSNPRIRATYAFDPIHHVLLFANPPSDLQKGTEFEAVSDPTGADVPRFKGVYQFDPITHALQRLMDENVGMILWNSDYDFFQINIETSADSSNVRIIPSRYEPGKGLVEITNAPLKVSPDRQWTMDEVNQNLFIMDDQGQPVQQVESLFGCGFSPGSDTYAEMIYEKDTGEGKLIIYSKQKNWQPVVARSITTDTTWSCGWINP